MNHNFYLFLVELHIPILLISTYVKSVEKDADYELWKYTCISNIQVRIDDVVLSGYDVSRSCRFSHGTAHLLFCDSLKNIYRMHKITVFSCFCDIFLTHIMILLLSILSSILKSCKMFKSLSVLFRYNKRLCTTERIRVEDENNNHWEMTRYYERESYKSVDQLKKHRVEKILLIITTIIFIGANIAYFVIKFNTDSVSAKKLNVSLSNKFLNEEAIIFLHHATYYIQLLDGFLSQLGIGLVLLVYFVVLLLQKSKVPIHSVLKLLFFYIGLKVLPSPTLLRDMDSTSIMIKYVMWGLAVIPFVSLIPAIPFICSRSLYDTGKHAVGLLRSYLELILKLLVYPDKMYRLLSSVSSVLGTCAFILIVLSIVMPWSVIRFRPNEEIRPAIHTVKNFISKVENILKTFKEVTDTVCGDTSKEMRKGVNKAIEDVEKATDNAEDPKALEEATKNLSSISVSTSCKNIDQLEQISCTAYRVAYVASIALMLVPFAGAAGKVALVTARVARKVFLLLKQFMRLIDKIGSTGQFLVDMLTNVLKDPFYEWTVTFKPEKYMLFFLFPCLITGLFFISMGFWRRKQSSEVKLRLIVSTISFVFLFTNSAVCAYIWISKWVTETALEKLPLIDVEVDELIGWKMIKLAYMFSSASSLLLWMYSSGKNIGEKEGDLTQTYDKNPYTYRKFENQWTTQKRNKKLRLHNDCGPTYRFTNRLVKHSKFPNVVLRTVSYSYR